jgi:hypothetical protein
MINMTTEPNSLDNPPLSTKFVIFVFLYIIVAIITFIIFVMFLRINFPYMFEK